LLSCPKAVSSSRHRTAAVSSSLKSGRKLLAAASTTGGDDATATNGCHARTEAVAMLADELARLIGPFHVSVSADISLSVNPVGVRL